MISIVTGATSFIGIALINKLINENEKVIAIVRPDSSRKLCIPKCENVSVVFSELSDLDKLQLNNDKCSTFYHIGWSSDYIDPRFNLSGQLKNVEYAEKAFCLAAKYNCEAFLSIGSQAECGRISGCITPYTAAKPETAYAIAKVVINEKLKSLCEEKKIKFCSPRLLSGYGPYDRPTTMIMSCITAGLKNVPLEMTTAEQIWDYIYVDDIANALYLIAKNGKHAKRYPIGSGIARSMQSYIYDIAKATGSDKLLEGIGKRQYNQGQVMNLLADITELNYDTGFSCEFSFDDGIKKTIEFVKKDDIDL